MSANAAQLFGRQYASNVDLLLQQKGSRLRKGVTEDSYVGEQASPVDQVGAIAMQPVTSRFGAIGRVDAPLFRRWVTPSDFDLPQNFDSFDKLKIISDPRSRYVENAVMAAGRQIDDLIIAAFFGTALTGTNGGTSTTFAADGGSTVAVDFGSTGNSGFTVAKLREAKRILMANEVDVMNDQIFAGINASAHDDLLQEIQVVSTDFNDRPVLVEGMVSRFLGINFLISERFAQTGDPYRRIPVWAKSGMHLGIWNEIMTNVSQRNDLTSQPWQAYLKMSMGATRLEGEKTVEVLSDEAA